MKNVKKIHWEPYIIWWRLFYITAIDDKTWSITGKFIDTGKSHIITEIAFNEGAY